MDHRAKNDFQLTVNLNCHVHRYIRSETDEFYLIIELLSISQRFLINRSANEANDGNLYLVLLASHTEEIVGLLPLKITLVKSSLDGDTDVLAAFEVKLSVVYGSRMLENPPPPFPLMHMRPAFHSTLSLLSREVGFTNLLNALYLTGIAVEVGVRHDAGGVHHCEPAGEL